MEDWRQLENFPAYEISSEGRLRRTLMGHKDRAGIWHFSLADGAGRYAHPRADELVAEAFLGPKPVGARLRHKDGDRDNNRAENLEWV